jgi:hypothetical protein
MGLSNQRADGHSPYTDLVLKDARCCRVIGFCNPGMSFHVTCGQTSAWDHIFLSDILHFLVLSAENWHRSEIVENVAMVDCTPISALELLHVIRKSDRGGVVTGPNNVDVRLPMRGELDAKLRIWLFVTFKPF